MMFRQVVLYALIVALISGLALTVMQRFQVVPIIFAAEAFEVEAVAPDAALVGSSHHVEEEAWAPADGFERTLFTFISNVLTAIGFALILMAAMLAAHEYKLTNRFEWQQGLLWGIAGYVVFWLAPAIGLPPEIPLSAAAPLPERQVWWIFAIVCTAVGVAGLAFAPSPLRWFAPVLLIVPHLVGAPHPEGALFAEQPPVVAAQLEELAQQFIGATALANAVFWLVMGVVAAWSAKRIIRSVDGAQASSDINEAHAA